MVSIQFGGQNDEDENEDKHEDDKGMIRDAR